MVGRKRGREGKGEGGREEGRKGGREQRRGKCFLPGKATLATRAQHPLPAPYPRDVSSVVAVVAHCGCGTVRAVRDALVLHLRGLDASRVTVGPIFAPVPPSLVPSTRFVVLLPAAAPHGARQQLWVCDGSWWSPLPVS